MSPEALAGETIVRSFPRVSGDEPFKSTLNFAGLEFSPREQG